MLLAVRFLAVCCSLFVVCRCLFIGFRVVRGRSSFVVLSVMYSSSCTDCCFVLCCSYGGLFVGFRCLSFVACCPLLLVVSWLLFVACRLSIVMFDCCSLLCVLCCLL